MACRDPDRLPREGVETQHPTWRARRPPRSRNTSRSPRSPTPGTATARRPPAAGMGHLAGEELQRRAQLMAHDALRAAGRGLQPTRPSPMPSPGAGRRRGRPRDIGRRRRSSIITTSSIRPPLAAGARPRLRRHQPQKRAPADLSRRADVLASNEYDEAKTPSSIDGESWWNQPRTGGRVAAIPASRHDATSGGRLFAGDYDQVHGTPPAPIAGACRLVCRPRRSRTPRSGS